MLRTVHDTGNFNILFFHFFSFGKMNEAADFQSSHGAMCYIKCCLTFLQNLYEWCISAFDMIFIVEIENFNRLCRSKKKQIFKSSKYGTFILFIQNIEIEFVFFFSLLLFDKKRFFWKKEEEEKSSPMAIKSQLEWNMDIR